MTSTGDKTDPRSRLTRQRLTEAGRKLFADHGYDQTTTAQIAEAAGVSERTFFRHFASKADLFLTNWMHIADLFRASIEAQPYRAPLIDVAREGMRSFADGFERAMETDPPATMDHYVATLPVIPMLRIVTDLESALSAELAKRIDRSDEDLDVRIAANTAIGILRACGRRYGIGKREVPLAALVSDELDDVSSLFDRLEP